MSGTGISGIDGLVQKLFNCHVFKSSDAKKERKSQLTITLPISSTQEIICLNCVNPCMNFPTQFVCPHSWKCRRYPKKSIIRRKLSYQIVTNMCFCIGYWYYFNNMPFCFNVDHIGQILIINY